MKKTNVSNKAKINRSGFPHVKYGKTLAELASSENIELGNYLTAQIQLVRLNDSDDFSFADICFAMATAITTLTTTDDKKLAILELQSSIQTINVVAIEFLSNQKEKSDKKDIN